MKASLFSMTVKIGAHTHSSAWADPGLVAEMMELGNFPEVFSLFAVLDQVQM